MGLMCGVVGSEPDRSAISTNSYNYQAREELTLSKQMGSGSHIINGSQFEAITCEDFSIFPDFTCFCLRRFVTVYLEHSAAAGKYLALKSTLLCMRSCPQEYTTILRNRAARDTEQ